MTTLNHAFASQALLATAVGIGLYAAMALPGSRAALVREVRGRGRLLLGLATFVALVAAGGSLYYSEVAGFVPCALCWYQRIAMYPLVLVLGVATFTGDTKVWRYALPLSLAGLLTSIYHVTIQFQPAAEVLACSVGASCTGRYVNVFGFVSIPVMAGGAFLLTSALTLSARWGEHYLEPEE